MKKTAMIIFLFLLTATVLWAGYTNILVEPGFEIEGVEGVEDAAHWQQGYNAIRDNTIVRSGSWAMKQESVTNSYGRSFRTVPSETKVQPEEAYLFTAYSYVVDNGVDTVTDFRRAFRISWLDENLDEIYTETEFADFTKYGEWEKVTYAFASPANAQYVAWETESQYNGTDGTDIYWDDLIVSGPTRDMWPQWQSGTRRRIDERPMTIGHRRRVSEIGEVIE